MALSALLVVGCGKKDDTTKSGDDKASTPAMTFDSCTQFLTDCKADDKKNTDACKPAADVKKSDQEDDGAGEHDKGDQGGGADNVLETHDVHPVFETIKEAQDDLTTFCATVRANPGDAPADNAKQADKDKYADDKKDFDKQEASCAKGLPTEAAMNKIAEDRKAEAVKAAGTNAVDQSKQYCEDQTKLPEAERAGNYKTACSNEGKPSDEYINTEKAKAATEETDKIKHSGQPVEKHDDKKDNHDGIR